MVRETKKKRIENLVREVQNRWINGPFGNMLYQGLRIVGIQYDFDDENIEKLVRDKNALLKRVIRKGVKNFVGYKTRIRKKQNDNTAYGRVTPCDGTCVGTRTEKEEYGKGGGAKAGKFLFYMGVNGFARREMEVTYGAADIRQRCIGVRRRTDYNEHLLIKNKENGKVANVKLNIFGLNGDDVSCRLEVENENGIWKVVRDYIKDPIIHYFTGEKLTTKYKLWWQVITDNLRVFV